MIAATDVAAQALDVAGDAVVTVDAGGQITTWNQQAEQLLGHRADQAVGQTLALLVHAAKSSSS